MAEPVSTAAAVAFGAKEAILFLGTIVISLLQFINRSQINGLKKEYERIEKKFDDEIKAMKTDLEKKDDRHRENIVKIFETLTKIQSDLAGLIARNTPL